MTEPTGKRHVTVNTANRRKFPRNIVTVDMGSRPVAGTETGEQTFERAALPEIEVLLRVHAMAEDRVHDTPLRGVEPSET